MFDDAVNKIVSEKELEQIYSDIGHKLPSTTMNSGLMDVYHNEPDNLIDDPEYFRQYCI